MLGRLRRWLSQPKHKRSDRVSKLVRLVDRDQVAAVTQDRHLRAGDARKHLASVLFQRILPVLFARNKERGHRDVCYLR